MTQIVGDDQQRGRIHCLYSRSSLCFKNDCIFIISKYQRTLNEYESHQMSAKSSLVNENFTIHVAFIVEIYIKLKPMHRIQNNIPALYILELDSFDV